MEQISVKEVILGIYIALCDDIKKTLDKISCRRHLKGFVPHFGIRGPVIVFTFLKAVK